MSKIKQGGKKRGLRYFAYVRKSSEGKERQALSIPAQIEKIKESFAHLDIEFVREERSAFTPFNRPAFERMVARIRSGERTGLVAWHPDRLSRNEKDAGDVTYMVRMGVIGELRFVTYPFENTPEGIWMLQMALSQSQYESAKKGRDVKRGLAHKASIGIYPAPAPLGYVNDRFAESGNKTILPDPDRFDLCRRMVDMMLTGQYSGREILRIATDEWRMTGPRGRPISVSNIYRFFGSHFYYGRFEYPRQSGNWHDGVHVPLMTRAEFDRIQEILGRPTRPRPKRHRKAFVFRGPLRCGGCGGGVTAEKRIKRQQNGNVHRYVYYHCTRKREPSCAEPAVREKELDRQVVAILEDLEIPRDFADWAVSVFRRKLEEASRPERALRAVHQRKLDELERKLDGLIDMRAAGDISDETFRQKREEFETARDRCEDAVAQESDESRLGQLEKALDFAATAREEFARGDFETRRSVFMDLGSNLRLRAGSVRIEDDSSTPQLLVVARKLRGARDGFEPPKTPMNTEEMGAFYTRIPGMLGALEDVRTSLRSAPCIHRHAA